MFATPTIALIKRETLATMRLKRTAVWLGLLVLTGILCIYANWPSGGLSIGQVWRNSNFGGYGNSESRTVFFALNYALLAAAMLFIPPLAAGAFAGERERDTLTMVSMTLIGRGSFLVGKLMNAVVFFLFLLIAFAPVYGSLFFTVGVDMYELAMVMAIITATAAATAALSLLASSIARTTMRATILAYALEALFFFGHSFGLLFLGNVVLDAVAGRMIGGAVEALGMKLLVLSPPYMVLYVQYQGNFATGTMLNVGAHIVYATCYFAVIALLSLIIARVLLRFHIHSARRSANRSSSTMNKYFGDVAIAFLFT